ncbi:MAG: hypothetical protein N2C14_03145, partial [Planctomycetales bacterium]
LYGELLPYEEDELGFDGATVAASDPSSSSAAGLLETPSPRPVAATPPKPSGKQQPSDKLLKVILPTAGMLGVSFLAAILIFVYSSHLAGALFFAVLGAITAAIWYRLSQ